MSITPVESPPTRHEHPAWHHSRRPTLHVSEPTDLPTIRSINEYLNEDKVSSTITSDQSSSDDERQKSPSTNDKEGDKQDDKSKHE